MLDLSAEISQFLTGQGLADRGIHAFCRESFTRAVERLNRRFNGAVIRSLQRLGEHTDAGFNRGALLWL